MDIDDFQMRCGKTAVYPTDIEYIDAETDIGLVYVTLGLAGEAGELANKVKKILRDDGGLLSDDRKVELEKELGDVMWYVAEFAGRLEVSLSSVCGTVLDKLSRRQDEGRLQGDGDNR